MKIFSIQAPYFHKRTQEINFQGQKENKQIDNKPNSVLLKDIFSDATDGVKKTGKAIFYDIPTYLYNKFFNKSQQSVKTQTVTKTTQPQTATKSQQTQTISRTSNNITKKSIIPEPQFSFNYDILNKKLQNITEVDETWVEANPEVVIDMFRVAGMNNIKTVKDLNNAFDSYTEQAVAINSLLVSGKFLEFAKEKYAQEKKAYLDEIMPKLRQTTTSKEDEIKIINAIEKYGTWEQGEKITGLMGFDEDIIQAVVRAIAQTATNPDDVLIITKYIRKKNHNYKPETYIQILNSAAKLGDVRSLGDDSKIMLDPIKKLLTHENADVRKAAQDALTAVTTKTGDIKIARN